jgi:hypothetical protein
MQVRYGEPTVSFVKESQPAIEKDFIGDERLVRA